MEGEEEARRPKRQKVDRHGRLSALEKFKRLKSEGSKRKYEVEDLENVYDVVDEDEYAERALRRREDDWIEDDDGCGYVEDGREIFDDEETSRRDESNARAKKRKAGVSSATPSDRGRGSVRNLIENMNADRKRQALVGKNATDDNILSDLVSEATDEYSRTKGVSSKSTEGGRLPDSTKRDTFASKVVKLPVDEEKAKLATSASEIAAVEIAPEPRDGLVEDIEFGDEFETNAFFAESKSVEEETFEKPFEEAEPKAPPLADSGTGNGIHAWPDANCFREKFVAPDNADIVLPTSTDGARVVRFHWWDAREDRFSKPGVVFLFGKIYIDHADPARGSVSCCVCVKNIDRKMFLLPRECKLDPITLEENPDERVTFVDVYEEFKERVATELNIKEFRSRKVTRNYAFDPAEVPDRSEYLEIRYPAAYPAPSTDETYSTFSRIFGANASSLETFLLERKIKGPRWLEIKNPVFASNKVSWCRVEIDCSVPENISIVRSEDVPPPPLTIATIHTRTVSDGKTQRNSIVMLACLISHSFHVHKPPPNPPFQQHFCAFTRPSDGIWPDNIKRAVAQFKSTKLTKCESERELLNYFLVQFWRLDPDLVVGHDLLGYQQDLLMGNILNKNIPNWSRLGRLRRTVVPQKSFAGRDAFLGRLVCDVKVSSMELIKSRSYDLDTLCVNVLKLAEGSRTDVTPDEIHKYYNSGGDILSLISLTMRDASYVLRIMCELNVLPLALQITQIAGNVMSKTLLGGRSERNEFLLLHAFTEKDYIVPDKVFKRKTAAVDNQYADDATLTKKQVVQSRKKPAYSGGLVLDPKVGFYDKLILLMDFNSLYPSIIQEYNICFTTMRRDVRLDDVNDAILPEPDAEVGILPTEIRKLVESRREVKKLMKTADSSSDLYMQYNIRQLALKLTANSMYGCLGFAQSRFYAKALAALVTLKGREILTDTKELVSRLNYDVIYGDTDSIMINTNCADYERVFKIGHDIKKEINKKYKHIELDIDGVFKYLLLLKKKKYAAVTIAKNKDGDFITNQELKGLDIVRRDWSQLAAEAGKFILGQILSEQSSDERIENVQSHLTKLRDELKDGKMPLSALIITKQLAKNPDEYPDKNGQPHVQVALRLNGSGNNRKYRKGDIVPYVICEDGTNKVAVQRAYHIEELKNRSHLKIDVNYYLAHQLHPVITRICDPIDGLDAARIADFLGLDTSSYKQPVKREASDAADVFQLEQEKSKYRSCTPFSFKCIHGGCSFENVVKDADASFLEKCQNSNCKLRPVDYFPALLNQLHVQIRRYVSKYYENWLFCEDPTCTNRTVKLPHQFSRGYPVCNMCEKALMTREYTERHLYNQIDYFRYLFDIANVKDSKSMQGQQTATITAALHRLRECAEDALSHSAYSVIDLSQLFGIYREKSKSRTRLQEEETFISFPDIDDEFDHI